MPFPRAPLTPRHSTTAFLGGVLAAGVIGAALARHFPPARSPVLPRALPPLAQNSPPAFSPGGDSDSLWRTLVGREPSVGRDEALSTMLVEIGGRDPARAIALALAEPNALLRQSLLAAALRGWTSVDPDAAVNWSLHRPLAERATDFAAVLQAAACDPAAALRLAARIIRDDPALAHDHGCSLVFALAQQGDFTTAAAFAAQGSPAHREAWLATAFAVWTEHQPQAAARAALAIPDAADRANAAAAVIARWSTLDPQTLAEFSLGLPLDATRGLALGTALPAWAAQNLAAASAWINRLEPSAELDAGVAAVATQAPLIASRPEIAVNWAESILDPELRVRTLAQIVGEWAKSNPAAARRYAENSDVVNAAERPLLLANLTPASGG